MNKIKVLHIIKSLGRGGAEMLLPETLKLHDKEQFEFHYIYFLPWKNQMVESIEKSGGIVNCLSAKNNIQLIFQAKRIISYCKQNHIQLIHCHLPWAGFVGRLVHKLSQIPVIYSEHNMQERYHKITAEINKLSFNSQTLALGVSEDVTNSINKNISPKIRVETLLNGVNTETFRRELASPDRKNLGIPENAIVVGNVAVFRFQKRLVEWLGVFNELQNRSTKPVYGLIVGAGPLEEEIKAKLMELRLERKVILTGLQTEVKPFYSVMDIFMMSSSFEGLPIALLEAMSMQCAIVSTNAGGIKEVIRHEVDGLICNVDNLNKLGDLAYEVVEDDLLRSELQNNARSRVLKNFSLNTMVHKLENYYKELSQLL